jgi:hypothetical protein
VTPRWLWLMTAGLLAMGCGPDQRQCTGPHADFVVILKLRDRQLPLDTVVHVAYGGSGTEDYSLMNPGADHEVVFCTPQSLDGGAVLDAALLGAAGASGEDDAGVASSGVDELSCELWTGGYASLEVHATGLTSMTYPLVPRDHTCTVSQTIVLDSPDGG